MNNYCGLLGLCAWPRVAFILHGWFWNFQWNWLLFWACKVITDISTEKYNRATFSKKLQGNLQSFQTHYMQNLSAAAFLQLWRGERCRQTNMDMKSRVSHVHSLSSLPFGQLLYFLSDILHRHPVKIFARDTWMNKQSWSWMGWILRHQVPFSRFVLNSVFCSLCLCSWDAFYLRRKPAGQ